MLIVHSSRLRSRLVAVNAVLIRYVLHQLLVHRGFPRLNLLLGSHLLALLLHTHILELIFVDKLGEELQDTL